MLRAVAVAVAVAACGPGAAPRPAVRAAAPPPAAGPDEAREYAFDELAVRIAARALQLEGTLSVPRAPGRRPAVVLIHGSGPLDRDETMGGQLGVRFGFEVAVFGELSRHLARAGFVVIRYDKRTCTRAAGCKNAYPRARDVSFDDVLEDVQAVIAWLRRRPEVDAAAIHLVGHSLGGAFVPELLTDNPDLRSGVLLAAPYRPIDQISAYQRDHAVGLLQEQELHPLAIGVAVRDLREIADGTRRLRAGERTAADFGGAPVAFWQAWMDLGDALPHLVEDLDRPLLAISGDADTNVPPSETMLWQIRFEAARPDPGHRSVVLPCVTHALNCTAVDARGRPTADRHISPALVDQVLQFLVNRGSGGV